MFITHVLCSFFLGILSIHVPSKRIKLGHELQLLGLRFLHSFHNPSHLVPLRCKFFYGFANRGVFFTIAVHVGRTLPVFFLCLRLTTDLATVIGMLDELELDATSAVLVVGRSSGELPLFCEVVGCCIPACSMLLHVIISGQLEQHRFGRNVDFHRDSPGLTSVPVLFVFVLTFKMLHFALTLFYGFLKPLFFI